MSSVAFWYQEGIATDSAAGALRLGAAAAGQRDPDRGRERRSPRSRPRRARSSVFPDLFWSKDVLIFKGEGPGSKVEIPFDVPEDGDYELYTQIAMGSDYGDLHRAPRRQAAGRAGPRARAGRGRAAAAQFDGYALRDLRRRGLPGRLAAPDEGPAHADLRVSRQERGVDAATSLGVDNIVLAKTGPAAWAAAAKVQEPRVPSGSRGRPREGAVGSRPRDPRPRRDGAAGPGRRPLCPRCRR